MGYRLLKLVQSSKFKVQSFPNNYSFYQPDMKKLIVILMDNDLDLVFDKNGVFMGADD